MALVAGVSVDVLDTEEAVLGAGLKVKHVGKSLLRLSCRAAGGDGPFSIVLEASDPEALAAWVAPLSAAALELDALVVARQSSSGAAGGSAAAASSGAGRSRFLEAFHAPGAPPAFGAYPAPPGGWPSGGAAPAWQALPFWDLFADAAMRPELALAAAEASPLGDRLRAALEMVAAALGRLPGARPNETRAAAAAAGALLGGVEVLRQLPLGAADASRFHLFLHWFVDRVAWMRPGHAICLPGGWAHPNGRDGHILLHVLSCEAAGTFALATVNTGPGLELHPYAPDGDTATLRRALTVTQTGIDGSRISDTAFWMALFRPLVFPSLEHGPGALYGTVLPYLTCAPVVLKAAAAFSDAEPPPAAGDASRGVAALEAARYLLRINGLAAPAARRACVRVRWSLLAGAAADLRAARRATPSEAAGLRLAARELCARASRAAEEDAALLGSAPGSPAAAEALSLEDLSSLERLAADVRAAADAAASPAAGASLPPEQSLALTAPGGAAWPLFGRLLLADVEALAGGARAPPLVRPVALTLVPDRVSTLHEAACALRHAERLCTLLANQAGLLKHSISLRLALLQHLFTSVLPLPLPLTHAARDTRCFWAAQPCRYETQADILALLRLLSRHYAAACLSLKADRALDAARLLTAACMASIADAVARKTASDVPSLFAGHYAGDAPGPLRPYGFAMRRFAAEAEALPLTSPEFATALTQARACCFAALNAVLCPQLIAHMR
jgi:hypothetical protein